MPKIKTEATQMTEARATFVSLVERGANRIPFKIVKQENVPMSTATKKAFAGLDLASIFKREKAAPQTPVVAAVACMKDDSLESVKEKLVEAGFTVDTAVEKDDGSILFLQGGNVLKDDEPTTVVKLNDHALLITKGFSPYNMDMGEGSFAEQCAAQGFYPGVSTVLGTMGDMVRTIVIDKSSPSEAATAIAKVFDEAKQYTMSFVNSLPTAAFKMDTTIEVAAKAGETTEGADTGTTEATVKTEPTVEGAGATDAGKEGQVGEDDQNKGADGAVSKSEGETIITAGSIEGAIVKKDDTLKAMGDLITKAMTDFGAVMKKELAGVQEALKGDLDGLTQNVTDLAGRVESVETVAVKAEKAVKGAVVTGSEANDEPVHKQETSPYAGREIDTSIRDVRKSPRAGRK